MIVILIVDANYYYVNFLQMILCFDSFNEKIYILYTQKRCCKYTWS